MKRLIAVLFLAGVPSWASYQPVTGSSVTVFATQGGALPVSGTFFQATQPTTVANSTMAVVQSGGLPWAVANSTIAVIFPSAQSVTGSGAFNTTGSTVGVVNGGTPFAIGNSTIAVIFASAQTVVQSTGGVNGSTIAVTNAVGTVLNVTVLASTMSITPPTVVASTVGVVNGGTPFQIANSTIAAIVAGSTVGVVNGGTPFQIANSTISAIVATSTIGVVNGGTPFVIANSTIGVVGINLTANNTVLNSTVGVVNGGTPFGIANSTIAVIQLSGSISNSTIAAVGTLADNGVAAGTNRLSTLDGIYQKAYLNGTAATQGRDAALSVLTDGSLQVWSGPDISTASYVGSTTTYTLSTTSMDVVGICGNSRTMVWIQSIRISCTQTTAGVVPITVAKRSTAYTAAFSTITTVALDSNYGVAGSTVNFFTNAGPQNGTLVGYVDSQQFECPAAATTNDGIYISPSDWKTKPIILRGSGQCLGVNFQFAAMSGAKITPTVTWFETATISP